LGTQEKNTPLAVTGAGELALEKRSFGTDENPRLGEKSKIKGRKPEGKRREGEERRSLGINFQTEMNPPQRGVITTSESPWRSAGSREKIPI